jgi:hypothetical protein
MNNSSSGPINRPSHNIAGDAKSASIVDHWLFDICGFGATDSHK